jgi:hypothetical protein
VTVSAAVPSTQETVALFGVDLYARGIQPVWLKVENRTDYMIRVALVSIDRSYFSPMEVAYIHRKGFSKKARAKMERHYHELRMHRQVEPGTTGSGYVFTHAEPGTKGFNVDVYGSEQDHRFTYFIEVPGFTPDHAEVDFDDLYTPDEIGHHDEDSLRAALAELSCCATNASGEGQADPINIVMVAEGADLLGALIRSGWHESPARDASSPPVETQYLYGRRPDAVFVKRKAKSRERNELRLWLAPMTLGDDQIWLGQITHRISRFLEGRLLGKTVLDPDVDDARMYLLQDIWYGQSLEKNAWLAPSTATSRGERQTDAEGLEYFTDGHRVVMWIADDPTALMDARYVEWDLPPRREGARK